MKVGKSEIPLTPDERHALPQKEKAVQEYEAQAFLAGKALGEILAGKLYRETCPTFEGYCKDKWDRSSDWAYLLIGAWRVQQVLTTIGVVLRHASQARPFISLTDEQIIAAAKLLPQISGGEKLTAKHFCQAAEKLRPAISHDPTSPTKLRASDEAAVEAIGLVNIAEKAANDEDKSAVLAALANLRVCLSGMAAFKNVGQNINLPSPEKASEPNPDTTPAPAATSHPHNVEVTKAIDQPAAPGSKAIGQFAVDMPMHANPGDDKAPAAAMTPNSTESTRTLNRPVAIRVGSSQAAIRKINQGLVFLANCLLEQGEALVDLPFIRENQSSFPSSARLMKLCNGYFIEVGDATATLLRKACRMLESCGLRHLTATIFLQNGETIELQAGTAH
jgi:hypothetical protein